MPRADKNLPNGKCLICRHPRRFEIELALASGGSSHAVAKRFGTSADSAWRHWTRHVDDVRKRRLLIGPVSIREAADKAAKEGIGLIDALGLIRGTLLELFQRVSTAGDAHATALISARLLEALRLGASLAGELRSASGGTNVTTNLMIVNSPAFAELQTMLLQRLSTFPDARASVLAGLRELDARLGGSASAAAVAPPALSAPIVEAEREPVEAA